MFEVFEVAKKNNLVMQEFWAATWEPASIFISASLHYTKHGAFPSQGSETSQPSIFAEILLSRPVVEHDPLLAI